MTDITEKKELSSKQKRIAALAGSVTKIDKLDFKHLRKHGMKAKKLKEEVDQIDELSKGTLASYIKSASGGMKGMAVSAHMSGTATHSDQRKMHWAKVVKRKKGIERAADKLTNEAIGAKDKQDEGEYGYEGDMAMSQLRTVIRKSEDMMKVLKKDTDLPEWVQSKITLATDYLQTACDYLMSELDESVNEAKEGMLFAVHISHPKGKKDDMMRKLLRVTGTDNLQAAGAHAQNHFTGQGFKVHKVTRLMDEEVEQVNEIGDKTLARYIDKAVVDAHNDAKWSGESGDRKSGNKAFKRVLGIKSAAARLGKTGLPHGGIHQYRSYKEEVEQIDEIGPAAIPAALAGAGAIALRVAAPMIARAGAAGLGRLGARAGITAAKKLGTSTMGAGRLGSKIGSQVGQQAIQSGVSSMADRLAAIRARQQQQANEDVAISADRKDDKNKGKYLGTKKGKTMTGERANPVNMNPEIRMPEQGRSAVDK